LVFANTIYEDPAARAMSDLDIGVLPSNLERASGIILDLGWKRLYEGRARYSSAHAHDRAFINGDGHVLELHYKLFHELGANAEIEPLFEHAISVELLGKPRNVPSWDDHLFLAAVHAATHAFGESLSWIFDLSLMSASVENAHREAIRRNCGFAFRSAMRTAHRALPQIANFEGEDLRERAIDRILRDRFSAPSKLQSLLARALLTEKPSVAAREIWRKLWLRARELRERRG
jgi:hypothetical protein